MCNTVFIAVMFFYVFGALLMLTNRGVLGVLFNIEHNKISKTVFFILSGVILIVCIFLYIYKIISERDLDVDMLAWSFWEKNKKQE